MFVHGTRDPFGGIDELRAAVSTIAAPVAVIVIDGVGHDLRRGEFDSAGVKALLGAGQAP